MAYERMKTRMMQLMMMDADKTTLVMMDEMEWDERSSCWWKMDWEVFMCCLGCCRGLSVGWGGRKLFGNLRW